MSLDSKKHSKCVCARFNEEREKIINTVIKTKSSIKWYLHSLLIRLLYRFFFSTAIDLWEIWRRIRMDTRKVCICNVCISVWIEWEYCWWLLAFWSGSMTAARANGERKKYWKRNNAIGRVMRIRGGQFGGNFSNFTFQTYNCCYGQFKWVSPWSIPLQLFSRWNLFKVIDEIWWICNICKIKI